MSRREIAPRAMAARRSAIREVFDAAERKGDVIRLEIGEPSFDTPPHIVEGAFRAAAAGWTRYGPNGGLRSLRELLVEKVRDVDHIPAELDEVVVTPGGMNALFSTYLALLTPGDEVLLPTPGFPNMDEMVRLLGGEPVFYTLRAENGFLPQPEDVAAAITPRTRVLFINSPSNPTGAVFPADLVERLVRLARDHDLWVISDEVYDELIMDDGVSHVAARRFDHDGRVITVYSFSKVYAMTGWRVGYVVAEPEVSAVIRKLQEPQYSCPSTISQKAAEAALLGPRGPLEAMRAAYRERREIAAAALARAALPNHRPAGTLYQLVDVSHSGLTSMDFALRLLADESVSVAPGTVFGPAGEGQIRISFATDGQAIEEGIARIGRAVHRYARDATPA